MWSQTILLAIFCGITVAVFYDSYNGVPIGIEQKRRYDRANITFWCVNNIKPCNPHEGRRVDGSCNNLKHPSRGASHTPFTRVLPAIYDKNYEPKKTASGHDMPLARYVRTSLIAEGKISSQRFTALAVHALEFMVADVVSSHDTINYVVIRPYCCKPKGKLDPFCAPNKIPEDDPVHRYSGERCINMTKPETFQSVGCVPAKSTPESIVTSTPLLDLSSIYGNFDKTLKNKGRLFKNGLLKYEIEDGRIWPPSAKGKVNECLLNQPSFETRCHDLPSNLGNTVTGVNLMVIWFWRNHNFIATKLHKYNPHWSDDRLFKTARDINIAEFNQLNYYELIPVFLGYDNLVKDGIIVPNGGFRDLYDDKVIPQLSLEYPFALRWGHTIQDAALKMFDLNGFYLKQFPIVNLTMRTGYFAVDNNIDYVTQGAFRQGSAKLDYVADPDLTERSGGPLQRVLDVMTNDLAKNRYLGFQPYIKYREICFGKPVRTFSDLQGVINDEYIEILRDLYEKAIDIDLMAGIWVEKPVEGGFVPSTFYCLVIDQLKRNMVSDRHWYERSNRPHAFNARQLAEIRKFTIARLLCDVGDKVTKIQPQAFLRAGAKNKIASCTNLPKINYKAWKEPYYGYL